MPGPTKRAALVGAALWTLVGCTEAPPPPQLPVVRAPLAVSFPPDPGSPAASADSWYADCSLRMTFALSDLLLPIARGLERQHIPYSRGSPEEWRDCSGNFLRLSSYVAAACPLGEPSLATAAGISPYDPEGSNEIDLPVTARSSRELAEWYHAQGRLVPVWYRSDEPASETIEAYRHLIKPGSVLWFAHSPPKEDNGVDQLFSFNLRGTYVRHVGTVVATERDDDGQVVSYAMYHGSNPGHDAGISEDHALDPYGDLPPFGNGEDYLAAIGVLLPAEPPMVARR